MDLYFARFQLQLTEGQSIRIESIEWLHSFFFKSDSDASPNSGPN